MIAKAFKMWEKEVIWGQSRMMEVCSMKEVHRKYLNLKDTNVLTWLISLVVSKLLCFLELI